MFNNLIKLALILICFIFITGCGEAVYEDITPEAYNIYAQSHIEFVKGDLDAAINDIKKAIKLCPNNYDFTYKLGMYYMSKPKPKPQNAKEALSRLKEDPDISQAMQQFQKAIDMNPDRWEGYIATARVYDDLDLFPLAIKWYDMGLDKPNITYDVKSFYTGYKEALIKRQAIKEGQAPKSLVEEKVNVPLDMKKWYSVSVKGNSKLWMAEFGLIGEEAEKYQWTKLFTISYMANYKYRNNREGAYNQMINFAEQQANSVGDKAYKNIISKDSQNLYFEWAVPKLNESEIMRIYDAENGSYFIRYTIKQPKFSNKERNEAIKLLKQVTTK